MAFMISQAVRVIVPVLDALATDQGNLSGAARQRIEALVAQHGPGIASVSSWDAPSRIGAFLDDLWAMGSMLPTQVVAELQAGQDSTAFGAAASLPSELRQKVLDRLVKLYEFRVFEDPAGLVDELIQLVADHEDRLLPDDRVAWDALVESYNRAHDPDAFLRVSARRLDGYPAVRQLLEGRRRWAPAPVRRGPVEKGISGAGGAGERALPADSSGEVVRYANVFFPAQVLATQRNVPLIVDIGAEYQEGARGDASEVKMRLLVGDIKIVLRATGFRLVRAIGGRGTSDTPTVRVVDVKHDRDCEPIVYFLDPLTMGRHTLALDFYQANDRPILALAFETEVVAQLPALTDLPSAQVDKTPLAAPARGTAAPPPDLELRVTLSGTVLSYYLNSPGGIPYNHQEVGRVDLLVDPLTFLKPTFDALNTLAKPSWDTLAEEDRSKAQRALDDIGHDLWRQLFPDEEAVGFRQAYHDIREQHKGRGVLIMSDETWIPWEVVKPYGIDDQGNIEFDDPPFCEQFQLSHWLAGRLVPDQLKMQRAAWVASAENLAAVKQESDYFRGLYSRQWNLVSMDGPLSKVPEVDERLARGDIQLFHFACHGGFDTNDPGDSKLKLADDFFTPKKISVAAESGLRRARPVVFLNACHGGRAGIGLTQIGGWAPRLVKAGVSAFIGGLWEVNDKLAAQFAAEFYDRLWGVGACANQAPLPLGQAFYEARMAIKAKAPGNPTWLAYLLYGDPYGKVVLGA